MVTVTYSPVGRSCLAQIAINCYLVSFRHMSCLAGSRLIFWRRSKLVTTFIFMASPINNCYVSKIMRLRQHLHMHNNKEALCFFLTSTVRKLISQQKLFGTPLASLVFWGGVACGVCCFLNLGQSVFQKRWEKINKTVYLVAPFTFYFLNGFLAPCQFFNGLPLWWQPWWPDLCCSYKASADLSFYQQN